MKEIDQVKKPTSGHKNHIALQFPKAVRDSFLLQQVLKTIRISGK